MWEASYNALYEGSTEEKYKALFLVIFKIENKNRGQKSKYSFWKVFTSLCFLASAFSFQQIAYKSKKLLPSASS